MSKRGRHLLKFNNYTYSKYPHTTKYGLRWYCSKVKNCGAYLLTTNDYGFIKATGTHNHDPNPKRKDKGSNYLWNHEANYNFLPDSVGAIYQKNVANQHCKTELPSLYVSTQSDLNSQNVPDNYILSKYSFPINDLNILRNMDAELNSELFFLTMVNYFSRFVGTNGEGIGEVLGKRLVERIMTQELMTKMSWTGVSRTRGCEKKFAFQTLANTSKMIYSVLLKADSNWCYERTVKLICGMLKYAKQRSEAETEKMKRKNKSYLNPDFPVTSFSSTI